MGWFLSLLGPVGIGIKILLSALGGGGLPAMVSTFTKYLQNKDNEATKRLEIEANTTKDVVVEKMHADTATFHDRVNLLKRMRFTQIVLFMALFFPVLHQSMIYFDSSMCNATAKRQHECLWVGRQLGMPWQVAKAPDPYADREWQIIAALLGIQTGISVGVGFMSLLRKK